ncbi:MAG TPA: ornithine cyclodeaminase family protein [Methanomicrobiales archaeon]|jgi:alanine dehydrogenase|nr:ornithine cyclodeaminase family protein [Methanomicrobiales archaeon]
MRYYYGSEESLDYAEVNKAVEAVFQEHARGHVQMPPKVYITFEHGDFRTMPAYVPALDMAGVKIVNVHPDNRAVGLPTVMALTVILDVATGLPKAIINATRLTDMRTGAAGAVAAKYLAPKKEVVLGVIGSGRQAEAQVEAISRELVITGIRVWSRDEKNALALAGRFGDLSASATSIEKACDADVVVTTTPSRKPIVMHEWIKDGTHINAIGADAPGKEELDPLILKRAKVFVDDRPQAIHSGEINVPITKGLFHAHDIAGTLGEVVVGVKGRKRPDEVTVFDSTGLAIQDLAIGKLAMAGGKWVELPFP